MNTCQHTSVVTTKVTAELACHRCDDCRTSWWEYEGLKVPLAEALDKLKALVDGLQRLLPARDLLSTKAVAALFNVTQRSVTGWIASGRLPAVRTPAGHLRIPREDVLKLLSRKSAA